MQAAGITIQVNGEELLLDAAGALYWPAEQTLVFADLHFEKGSSYGKRGQLLPPYDTRTTLKRIELLMNRYQPLRVLALGDSFHDAEASARLDAHERCTLMDFGARARWIWIAGNHDPQPPAWLDGTITEEAAIGGLVFRHEPGQNPEAGEIAGHLHPCATLTRRGRSLTRKCFVSDGLRLVMPAFGAYTGGLDIRATPVQSLFKGDFFAYLLGARRVYALPA
jgi:DNA ligase-associated metallophosphoesterase